MTVYVAAGERGTTSSPSPSLAAGRASNASPESPASTGATPIQNVGAYGQDVSETIIRVEVDRTRHRPRRDADELGLRLRLPPEHFQKRREGSLRRRRRDLPPAPRRRRVNPLSRAANVPRRTRASTSATCRKCAKPSSPSASGKGWSSIPPIPTRAAMARSS